LVIARSVNRSAVLAVEVKGQGHPELPRGVELEALRDGDLGELDGDWGLRTGGSGTMAGRATAYFPFGQRGSTVSGRQ
jgi:hypothetical protein